MIGPLPMAHLRKVLYVHVNFIWITIIDIAAIEQ